MNPCRGLLALLGACVTLGVVDAQSPPSEGWDLSLTPYLWAPSIDGTVKGDGMGGESEDDGGSALDYLSGAFMLSIEARRGDWALLGDLLWARFETEGTLDGPMASPFGAENEELLISLGAARTLSRGESAQLDGVFGLRYFHVDLSLDLEATDTFDPTSSADLLDPFVGVRGRVGGETGLFGSAYADIGGFGISSDLTWQVLATAGWAWNWGDVRLGWRELAYDFDSSGILYDLTASGPLLGVAFQF